MWEKLTLFWYEQEPSERLWEDCSGFEEFGGGGEEGKDGRVWDDNDQRIQSQVRAGAVCSLFGSVNVLGGFGVVAGGEHDRGSQKVDGCGVGESNAGYILPLARLKVDFLTDQLCLFGRVL